MTRALGLPGGRTYGGRLVLWAIVLAGGLALALLPLTWLVVAVPAALVVVATLVRPQRSLTLLCFAIPFGSLFEVNVGGITVGVTEGLIGLTMAAWVARSSALGEKWTWSRTSGALALFIGAALLSLINASSLPLALKETAKWIECLGVVLLVANTVTRQQSRGVVAALLLSGTAQALVGMYQFVTQSGPEFFVLGGRFMRAYGTFEQPNPYAGYLGMVAPLALALTLSVQLPWKRPGRAAAQRSSHPGGGAGKPLPSDADVCSPPEPIPAWLKWLGLVSFGALTVAIGMSWSRGGWLAFGAALVAVNLARSRRGAVLFAALIALVAAVGLLGSFRLLPDSVTRRLTGFLPFVGVSDVRSVEITDENYAAVERLAHWQAALSMWSAHPWVGVGFGNYESAYADHALPKWPLALGHAHNYYLNVAAETGLVGLTAYLATWAVILWEIGRAIRGAGDPYTRAIALGTLGVVVHASVHNVVDNLWVHNMYIQVAICLGLVHAAGRWPKVQTVRG